MVTDVALQNFEIDVRFIEDFVKQLGDPTVLETITPLRQVRKIKEYTISGRCSSIG